VTEDNINGIAQLHARRARRTRNAPQPRHPKLTPEGALAADPDTEADPTHEQGELQSSGHNEGHSYSDPVSDPGPQGDANPADQAVAVHSQPAEEQPEQPRVPAPAPPPSPDVIHAAPQAERVPSANGGALPQLEIDATDPTAHMVSPTVLSIPASIVKRFERARANAPSHTALVLDALRAHAQDLPTLILTRRPGLNPGDLFPFREAPGRTSTDTPLPVRIRPTKGELAVMKKLADWASARIAEMRPGARETNRSEMVAAALDAFLPAAGRGGQQ